MREITMATIAKKTLDRVIELEKTDTFRVWQNVPIWHN